MNEENTEKEESTEDTEFKFDTRGRPGPQLTRGWMGGTIKERRGAFCAERLFIEPAGRCGSEDALGFKTNAAEKGFGGV
jgi:hypothetical protein